jgi:hypothetical protein
MKPIILVGAILSVSIALSGCNHSKGNEPIVSSQPQAIQTVQAAAPPAVNNAELPVNSGASQIKSSTCPDCRTVDEGVIPRFMCASVRVHVSKLLQRRMSGAQGVANAKGFYNYTPSQAKRWERRFLKFSYDVRALARKYPEEDASFASGTLARVDKQREDRKQP